MANDKIAALQANMKNANVDLVALGPTANMRYLLGFTPHPDERICLLFMTQRDVCMVVPALNRDDAAKRTSIELVAWADEDGPSAALRKATAGAPATCAIDGLMRADFLLSLQQNVSLGKTISAEPLLAPLRERKSPEEVEGLARAAAQADRAMQAGVNACQPGVTEASVAWAVESAFRQDGAEVMDFALIAAGPNGAFPHHHSGERRLAKGDAIILDIGATLDGFKSDITRMVHLGKPSDEFQRAYSAVLKANEKARATVRPGLTAGEIDRVARSTLEAEGYGELFTHRTGHGIGLEVHERPWITAGDPTVLAEGMAFSVEPGVYLVDRFGVRIEDIVVVTTTGSRTLTSFDHALFIKD